MTMLHPRYLIALAALSLGLAAPQLHAHCQVPCGIFDDYIKLETMKQDADTIIKAAAEMQKLAAKTDAQSKQQFIRWANNKESHAQSVIESISDYYLTQRVKTSMEDYNERLLKHHAVMIAAMKAKQSADMQSVNMLRESVQALSPYYPASKQ